MTSLKTVFAAISVLIGCLLLFIYLTPSPPQQLNVSFEYFLEGEPQKAQKALLKMREDLPEAQYALYNAYIQREIDLKVSNEWLAKAERANRSPFSLLALEISLNQALNAYLENDPSALEAALDKANQSGQNHSDWIQFFAGLENFYHQEWQKALEKWEVSYRPNPLSPWMKKAFDQVFTPFWLTAHIARSDIELGNYIKARQSLEMADPHATPEEQEQIDFLLGLSYAREAIEKPVEAAVPYYKLAFSYFNEVPAESGFYKEEREKITSYLKNDLQELLEKRQYHELPFYFSLLEPWLTSEDIERYHQRLRDLMNREIRENHFRQVIELAEVLDQTTQSIKQRQDLADQFLKLAQQSLDEGDFTALSTYWKGAKLFNSNQEVMSTKMAGQAERLIFLKLAQSKDALPYFQFWQQLDLSSEQKVGFIKIMITALFDRWKKTRDLNAPLSFIKDLQAVLRYEQKELLKEALESEILSVYAIANKNNDVDLLSQILTLQKNFGIIYPGHLQKAEAVQQAGEARELYQKNEVALAKRKAEWVLRIDPNNQDALFIAGIIDYHEGDFKQSLVKLKAISNPSAEVGEALAIAEILSGASENEEKILNQIQKDPKLPLVLGLGFLIQNDPESSLKWLKQVQPVDNETTIGLLFAHYYLKEWKQVIEDYKQLIPPYNQLFGVQGALAISYAEEGDLKKAEEILQTLLQKHEAKEGGFSPHFQSFHKKVIAPLSPDYATAIFYKKFRKNPGVALEYLEKISHPSSSLLLEKAALLIELNRMIEAQNLLEKLLKDVNQDQESFELAQTWRLLAQVYVKLTLFPEAVSAFQHYLEMDPTDFNMRLEYAKALISISRWDLALIECQNLEKAKSFNPELEALIVGCLVHLDNFIQANARAEELTKNPQVPLFNLLQIGRQMAITLNESQLTEIFNRIKGKTLSVPESEELAALYLDLGDYTEAAAIVEKRHTDFQETVSGLLLLARYYWGLSKKSKALSYAFMALHLEPYNLCIVDFLNHHEQNPRYFEQQRLAFKQKIEQDPEMVSWKLGYANNAIHQAFLDQSKEGLHVILTLVKGILHADRKLPQAYFLLGQTFFLLEKNISAMKAYKKALVLNKSDVEAYKALSRIEQRRNAWEAAQAYLQTALKFAPFDAEAWNQLAQVEKGNGNMIDAIAALRISLRFRPNEITSYLTLAKLSLEINNPEDARAVLEKAFAIDPKNQAVLSLLFMTLHDPNLESELPAEELSTLKKEIYEAYHRVAPKAAEEAQDFVNKRLK